MEIKIDEKSRERKSVRGELGKANEEAVFKFLEQLVQQEQQQSLFPRYLFVDKNGTFKENFRFSYSEFDACVVERNIGRIVSDEIIVSNKHLVSSSKTFIYEENLIDAAEKEGTPLAWAATTTRADRVKQFLATASPPTSLLPADLVISICEVKSKNSIILATLLRMFRMLDICKGCEVFKRDGKAHTPRRVLSHHATIQLNYDGVLDISVNVMNMSNQCIGEHIRDIYSGLKPEFAATECDVEIFGQTVFFTSPTLHAKIRTAIQTICNLIACRRTTFFRRSQEQITVDGSVTPEAIVHAHTTMLLPHGRPILPFQLTSFLNTLCEIVAEAADVVFSMVTRPRKMIQFLVVKEDGRQEIKEKLEKAKTESCLLHVDASIHILKVYLRERTFHDIANLVFQNEEDKWSFDDIANLTTKIATLAESRSIKLPDSVVDYLLTL